MNAGKESVVCDLPADADFARALLARADVVLESFRPGVAARLGVGPDDVPADCVYCSITGFGVGGPHEQRAGHDLNYLGWAGLLHATAPALPPVQAADLAAGALGAVTEVLAALLRRERGGGGARIVVSMTHGSQQLAPASAGAHGRVRVLLDLRVRGRPPAHSRRARAEVLRAALRARRPSRARRTAVRARARRSSSVSSRTFLRGSRWNTGFDCCRKTTYAWGRSRRRPRGPPSSACLPLDARLSSVSTLRSGGGSCTFDRRLCGGRRDQARAARHAHARRERRRDRQRRPGRRAQAAGDRRPRRRLLARRDVHRLRPPRRPLARELGRQRAAPPHRDAERRGVGPELAAGRQEARLYGPGRGAKDDPHLPAADRTVEADRREQRPGVRRRGVGVGTARLRLDPQRRRRSSTRRRRTASAPFRSTRRFRRRRRRRSWTCTTSRGRPTRRSSRTPPTSRTAPLRSSSTTARRSSRCRSERARLVAGRNANRVRRRDREPRVGRRRRNRSPCARRRRPARLAAGSGRHAEVPEPRAARRRAASSCPASRGHWQLGFTSMVDNRGPGILWIRGTRAPNAHMMDVRQLVQLSSRRDARRPAGGPVALRRRAAALPLAHARLRPLRAAERRRLQADGARPQERVLHRRPLRDRDRRAARPASFPRATASSSTRRPATSKRDRRSATPTAIPPSSTGRASTSRT